MNRSKNPKKFLSDDELYRVTTKIAAAESMTSAEIKLVIVKHCLTSIKRKALKIFKKYKLDQTVQRNCVLILVVTTNRQFLIYGDQGIHEKVGQDFWEEIEKSITIKFLENKVLEVTAERDELRGHMNHNADVAIRCWQGLKDIHLLLGYGIKGSPTDGDYHARTYKESYNIANRILEQLEQHPRAKSITVDEAVMDCREFFGVPEKKTEDDDGRPSDEGKPAEDSCAEDRPDAEDAEPHPEDAERARRHQD